MKLIISTSDLLHHQNSPFYTQIPHFTEWSPLFPFAFILLFGVLSITKRQINKDLFSSCLFPAIQIQIYYTIIYFGVRPFLQEVLNGFRISGHLLRAGLGNGIWLRNYSWMKRHEEHIKKPFFIMSSSIIFFVLIYEAYENFWTTLYFHTLLEVLAGFGLATLNFLFPTFDDIKNKFRKEKGELYAKKEDNFYIELPELPTIVINKI